MMATFNGLAFVEFSKGYEKVRKLDMHLRGYAITALANIGKGQVLVDKYFYPEAIV